MLSNRKFDYNEHVLFLFFLFSTYLQNQNLSTWVFFKNINVNIKK